MAPRTLAGALTIIAVLSADAGCRRAPRPPAVAHWVVAFEEHFEGTELGAPAWSPDGVPDDGPFSEAGSYFVRRGIRPPPAFRFSHAFGQSSWLTVEAYSRSRDTAAASLASVVVDPADPHNHALRLRSPRHTDAVLIRSSRPLPERYRISLRIGYASFGDGRPGLNGYHAPVRAEPWLTRDATGENGFYWLAILDTLPRPHNNVWIHHHRKLVIDSDNNVAAWTEIWDGSRFVPSGERPVMLFALDGRGKEDDLTGPPFIAWSAGRWQRPGAIRAVDRYEPRTWYQVSVAREGDRFAVRLRGDFALGAARDYVASLDAAAACVFHFNRTPRPGGSCPAASRGWPDYFLIGDPHINFYEGEVLVDDLRLEIWR